MSKTHGLESPIIGWLNKHAPQGVVITDAGLMIQDWNVWMEANSGIEKSGIIGQSLFAHFPEIVSRGLSALYEDALRGQVRVLSHRFHEYLIPMPSPTEPGFEKMQQTAQIAPLVAGTRIVGTITTIYDVTERTARERELRNAREAAEAANRSKDRFVAMLSHDLRVPLSSAIGWVRLFKTRQNNPEFREKALNSIEHSILAELQLIEDLMDVARISSGKLELKLDDADLAKVVNEACNLLKPLADSKSIRLLTSVQEEVPVIRGDEKRMQQVVWNLLSNALKFTPAGGTIQVELDYSGNGLRLAVTDTGTGLSKDMADHIFEPMWQSPTGKSQGGLGLGLSIVRKIVELHGGSVTVESDGPGKGAAFIVDLPKTAVSAF